VNPETLDLDKLKPEQIVRAMARAEVDSVAAFEKAAPDVGRAASLAAAALVQGGRIIFVGAGTSGRLGALEAAECPPTFGTEPHQVLAIMAGGEAALTRAVEGAEDRGHEAFHELERVGLSATDLVVGIAASGRTPFVRAALTTAREKGAFTVLVTCDPASKAETPPPADIIVALETGPEVLTGSTRLKAGTATKMALNAITTAAFVARGKVYGNFMVDLQATNEKLKARAQRIVAAVCGCPNGDATLAIEAAGGSVKLAIAMKKLGLARADAEARLKKAGGRLRAVIG